MRLIWSGIALAGLAAAAGASPAVKTPPPLPQPPLPMPMPAPPAPPPLPLPPPQCDPTGKKTPSCARPARPRGNPGIWVTNDDYPTRALRERREGRVGFRITVGPDGRATACHIVESSGSADLDATSCGLVMRRARFIPALDDGGLPTQGRWIGKMNWSLPPDN